MNFKMPKREQISNKGTFGKVLNICGSDKYIGAAYLSTISSLKVGAGLSALASTHKVIGSVSTMLPEAIYLSYKDSLKKLNTFNVILIGCGLGLSLCSQNIFTKVLRRLQKETKPVVIDADGLNLLSKKYQRLPQNCIITPHLLEASRLLKCSIEEVQADLELAAKKLTQKYECITVLKSHRTVICDTNLNTYINKNGNSSLAKAGTGDVLAGIIAGLLAQKMDNFEAAKLGVYLHSRTAEILSEKYTEYSILASDLVMNLNLAIKECV